MPNRNSISCHLARARAFVASVVLLVSSAATANAMQQSPSGDWSSTIFSTYGVAAMFVVLLVGLVVYKRSRSAKPRSHAVSRKQPVRTERVERNQSSAPAVASELPVAKERRAPVIEGAQVWEKPAEVEQSAFGAYRIDQEVAKLTMGRPHRMDVMASRVPDDRRAIEASLIKALESSDTTEEGRNRIRQALEEYGFVARQSATMLMGRDAWERSSAARVLGQIRVPASLPFLIEALHDTDSVVRNQAVTSLGALKMPSAIGALLDIARRHPEIPASLLCETLSACTVDSFGYLDAPLAEPAASTSDEPPAAAGDLERLVSFSELPSGAEDAEVTSTLADLASPDPQARAVAAQQLSLYRFDRSVAALTNVVVNDAEASVRAAAVASLGSIDHESVLAPVLIALADESRTVRAAAARTLSGLHFERADAYVRLMETSDLDLMRKVAESCVETGIFSQAVDRLASEDRRQAQEAFSLFSLLVRAHQTDPIIDVIQNHKDQEVRLSAVRVLSMNADPSVAPKLRAIVGGENIPEQVRTAVLEVLYKLDQDRSPIEFHPSDIQPVTLHNPQ